jgi:hypothetical protein
MHEGEMDITRGPLAPTRTREKRKWEKDEFNPI